MRYGIKAMQGHRLLGTDGEIGTIEDVFFDDERWAVRYFVVRVGGWGTTVLGWDPGKDLLFSPGAIEGMSPEERVLRARLSRKDAETSPPADAMKPVSRQYASRDLGQLAKDRAEGDPHLRSSIEVFGYALEASDGGIGRVEDLVVETDTWTISDLLVDANTWLPGGKVVIAPEAVESIDWPNKKVRVRLSREQVQRAPAAR
jgi:sporulation protein YlmC with PRC-barrel domain